MQRKCGTCKYFEEGGIASSGWCRHPERQDIEHMVLVRKTELACRHGWDEDLWEPRDGGSSAEAGAKPTSKGRMPQKSAGNRQNGRTVHPLEETKTDSVVASSGTPAPAGHGKQSEPSRREATGRAVDNRADPARNAWSSTFDAEPAAAAPAVDELQDETVVSRTSPHNSDWQGQLESYRNQEPPAPDPIPRPPVFGYEPQSANGQHPVNESPDVGSERDDAPVQQSGLTEQFDVEPVSSEHDAALSDVQGSTDQENPVDSLQEGADADRSGSIELPMLEASNACCRNCRDFIPAKGGWSGWCNNPYAFEKRQEVSGDRVSCQNSFGSWWSPSDDWWMERADIAHHSAPTPLVDNLIRQIRTRYLIDEGSTEGQERS